jgi:hypothetical protein
LVTAGRGFSWRDSRRAPCLKQTLQVLRIALTAGV